MFANFIHYLNGEFERATPFGAAHRDGRARDGCQKRLYFKSKRLIALDRKQAAQEGRFAFPVGLD
jgi:hypothetical protein